MTETKKCFHCKIEKPIKEFRWKSKGKRQARCNPCFLTPAKIAMIRKAARKQGLMTYYKKKRLVYHKNLKYLKELKETFLI